MPRRWDIFCRVIDNHGDLVVAWRLAADLAGRGEQVRLWVDDASALAWMAPQGQAGVERVAWSEPAPDLEPGEVVVEAFGCALPPRFLARMADRAPAPDWFDLEYLSAEAFVERSHGLPSPQTLADGRTLLRRMVFPGFTPRSGGLLREPGLLAQRDAFDPAPWLAAHGIAAHPGERIASLFCYANPALPAMLDLLAAEPTLLLAAPGPGAGQLSALLGPGLRRGALRVQCLPWLTQPDYDRLLWSCELNFVRGEDSFVRAQWAGQPFVWQAYPQRAEAHRAKLLAFLDRMLAGAAPRLGAALRALMLAWNGFAPVPETLPPPEAWRRQVRAWRAALYAQADLSTQLLGQLAKTR